MQAKVKTKDTANAIAELAKEFELAPGHVYGVLSDLGIEHDGANFEADDDAMALIREALTEQIGSKEVSLKPNPTPRDVAMALGVPQPDVQKTLMTKMRVMATLTTTLKAEVAEQLAGQYGYTIRWSDSPKPRAATAAKKAATGVQTRPPVVTIMGHVDHGKTSLLDYIRKANVAAKEHGGITQHIGAYQVEVPEGKITFLDTPGHAAFTAMRARGAQVTDIAILVVAADDGVMPQTKEAISHIQNAEVPMIVAVNKVDKPDAQPDRVMMQLPEFNVVPEKFGGQVQTFEVSAVTGAGVPELLEGILLQAEMLELKADPKGKLEGVVIEAKMDKGRGAVATILVETGTLKIGDSVVVGQTYGRIRSMSDYRGEKLLEAGPSTPVEILGLEDVPQAGDAVEFAAEERDARQIAQGRATTARDRSLDAPSRGMTLRELREKLATEELKELKLVVKADVQGSVEAVKGMLEKVKNEEVETRIIHAGVGPITESDILLASAADAICVGFNIKPEPGAKREAERRKVEIRTYSIIYELIEDIEAAVKGMLEPKFEESHLGEFDIRVRFQFGRKGVIAGCYVTEGKIVRNALVRVRRNKELVHQGKVASLKHLKDDVREVTMGMECGVTFEGWEAFKEGDVVEAYEMVQVNA